MVKTNKEDTARDVSSIDSYVSSPDVSRLPGSIPLGMSVSDYDEHFLVVENVRPYGRVDVGGGQLVHPYVLVEKTVLSDPEDILSPSRSWCAAIRACEDRGLVLPPASVLCPVLVALHAARDRSYVAPTLAQFKDTGSGWGWHHANTFVAYDPALVVIVDYPERKDFPKNWRGNAQVNHGLRRAFSFQIENFNGGLLEVVLRENRSMTPFVQGFSGLEDPGLLVPVGQYFRMPMYVTLPYLAGRIRTQRFSSVGAGYACFNLDCDGRVDADNAVRGIQFHASAPQ